MVTISVGISLSAVLPKEVPPQMLPPTFNHTAVLLGCIHQCCILSELPSGSITDFFLLCEVCVVFPYSFMAYSLVPFSGFLLLYVLCSQWAEAGIRCFLPPLLHFAPLSHFFPGRSLRATTSAWHCLVNRTLGTGLSQLSYIARMLLR